MKKFLLRIAKAFGFGLTPEEKLAAEKAEKDQKEWADRISDELWI